MVYRGLTSAGLLCTGNALCFVTRDVRFSLLGIVGYDFILPLVCVLIAVTFNRTPAPP
jgi:hypothetical protein